MQITLEPLVPAHAEELFGVLQDPRLYTYVPQDPPESIQALRDRYAFMADPSSPPEDERWLNWVMRNGGRLPVGMLQATVGPEYAAIAYTVFTPFWQRGYATAGCETMLELLRAQYEVREARAWCDTRNEASYRLLERLGFERVAFHAKADFFKGASSDEFEYCLRF